MVTVTLIRGDCLEVLPTLKDNSIDLAIADPPYFKVKKEWWDRQWDTAEGFIAWVDRMLEQLHRVVRPNGSLYLFASPKMSARVELAIGKRFNVLSNITWLKNDNGSRRHAAQLVDKGLARTWFPDNERIVFAEHYGADSFAKGEAGYGAKCDELRGFLFEPLRAYLDGERQRAGLSKSQVNRLFGGPNVGQYWWQRRNWQLPTADNYQIMRDGFRDLNHGGEYLRREYEDLRREYEDLRREYEDLRRPFSVTADVPYTDVWDFPTVQAYPGKHPCEKPQAMLEHMITASSRPCATVLDFCMGSGNTGRACVKTGRSFIGVDIMAQWHNVATTRIQAADDETEQPQQLQMEAL